MSSFANEAFGATANRAAFVRPFVRELVKYLSLSTKNAEFALIINNNFYNFFRNKR